jgi:hypothetical protein
VLYRACYKCGHVQPYWYCNYTDDDPHSDRPLCRDCYREEEERKTQTPRNQQTDGTIE